MYQIDFLKEVICPNNFPIIYMWSIGFYVKYKKWPKIHQNISINS